jgi:hypothetical protein
LLVVSHVLSLPLIFLQPFIAEDRRKSAGAEGLKSNKKQAPPRNDGAWSQVRNQFSRCQRPKNNHSKMITGIGTPNSHNKTPRPMLVSSTNSTEGRTWERVSCSCAKAGIYGCRVRYDWNLRERQLNSKQRLATLIDGLAHLGVDVNGLAAAPQLPVVFGRPGKETARPPSQTASSWDGGHACRIDATQRLTSGRC